MWSWLHLPTYDCTFNWRLSLKLHVVVANCKFLIWQLATKSTDIIPCVVDLQILCARTGFLTLSAIIRSQLIRHFAEIAELWRKVSPLHLKTLRSKFYRYFPAWFKVISSLLVCHNIGENKLICKHNLLQHSESVKTRNRVSWNVCRSVRTEIMPTDFLSTRPIGLSCRRPTLKSQAVADFFVSNGNSLV